MERSHSVLLAAALLAAAGSVSAGDISLNHFNRHYLPVLVQVNVSGKVTSVAPADRLDPALGRLLRNNISQMITHPAKLHGRPISSQFVMNLAVKATPRAKGGYDAHFVYLSSSPVPSGSWYWVHTNGVQLALVNRNGLNHERRRFEPPQDQHDPDSYRSMPTSPPSLPAQNAGYRAPVALAASGKTK